MSNRVFGKNKQDLEIDYVKIICGVSRNSSVIIVTLCSEVPSTQNKFVYLGVICCRIPFKALTIEINVCTRFQNLVS